MFFVLWLQVGKYSSKLMCAFLAGKRGNLKMEISLSLHQKHKRSIATFRAYLTLHLIDEVYHIAFVDDLRRGNLRLSWGHSMVDRGRGRSITHHLNHLCKRTCFGYLCSRASVSVSHTYICVFLFILTYFHEIYFVFPLLPRLTKT